MLFSIDEDVGTRLEGWVMPDNPGVTPSVIVHLNPVRHIAIEAFVFRPLLKENSLHNTGICGFVLDENNCPGLTSASELEIYDADNNVLLYRRAAAGGSIEKKFFRLEPQLFRSVALDSLFIPRFHMAYAALELLAEETVRSILSISFTPSIYAAGRVLWREWEPLLRDRGYRTGILLRDPYHELAERLLILRLASSQGGQLVKDALGEAIEPAAASIRDVNLADRSALEALLADPPAEVKSVLYNPLTYLLSAQNAFDPPPTPATAVALDSLADMDVIGLREETGFFFETILAVLELATRLEEVRLPTGPNVLELADSLRDLPASRTLIEMDLEVYGIAAKALSGATRQRASALP
jgi:hypothetical protein